MTKAIDNNRINYYNISIGACSKRYMIAIMGFIGIANAYAMRSVLSVAITEMVEDIHKTAIDPNGCPGPTKITNTTNVVCCNNII